MARALRRADITAQVTRQPLRRIDRYLLPALLLLDDGRALVLVGNDGEHAEVLVPQSDGGSQRMPLAELEALYSGTAIFAKCRYRPDGRVGDYASALPEHWFFGPLKRLWRSYAEVTAAALVANVLAVASALFAMQVYDRVVPNAAFDTLWILASGVALAIILDGVLRIMRGHLLNVLGKRLDLQLSTLLFSRVLSTRVAAKPASMGAFSTQVREFESVREFFTSSSAALISDLPFVAIFLLIIAVIGGHVVWVPLVACVLMILPGLLTQRLLGHLSRQNLREGAMKNGVLLEAFEHLETVKATRAEGRCLHQWETLTGELAGTAMKTHTLASTLSYSASIVQQLCYVGVVVFGVYRISEGAMTVGGLVACSILASRAIAPLSQAAGILGRWQHTKVAMEGLDQLMSAEQERPQGKRFVHKERLQGHYRLEGVRLAHGDSPPVVDVQALNIRAGERVALLGGNGAGKSTLLRLLSGLLDAQAGRLLLDDVSLTQPTASAVSATCRRTWRCSMAACATTSTWRTPRWATRNCWRPSTGSAWAPSSAATRWGWTCRSRAMPACPAASARPSGWPGCCYRTLRSCCSTSRPRPSTRAARNRSSTTCSNGWASAPWSSPPTRKACSPWSSVRWSCARAG